MCLIPALHPATVGNQRARASHVPPGSGARVPGDPGDGQHPLMFDMEVIGRSYQPGCVWTVIGDQAH